MFEPLNEYQTTKHLVHRNHLKMLRVAVYDSFQVGVRRAVEVDRGFRIWKLVIQRKWGPYLKTDKSLTKFRTIHARIIPWNHSYYVVFGTVQELENLILP